MKVRYGSLLPGLIGVGFVLFVSNSGCSRGFSASASKSSRSAPNGSGKVFPIFSNTTLKTSALVSAGLFNRSSGDVTSASFDVGQKFLYDDSWAFLARLSGPAFNGFELRDYANGSIFESDFYSKKVTTSVTETDEYTQFDGDFGDGGGSYRLTINKNSGTYVFEQRLIIDAVHVQPAAYVAGCAIVPQDAGVCPSYIGGARKLIVFSTMNGSLSGTVADGTGITRILELTPLYITRGQIRSLLDFDLEVSDTWVHEATSAYVYETTLKANEKFLGVRNKNIGHINYQFNHIYEHPSVTQSFLDSASYQSSDLWSFVSALENVSQDSYSYQDMGGNYLSYYSDGEWQTLGPSSDPLVSPQIVLDQIESIWSQH